MDLGDPAEAIDGSFFGRVHMRLPTHIIRRQTGSPRANRTTDITVIQ